MKRLIAIAAVLSACQGCTSKNATVSADSPSAVPAEPGAVVIPEGSPMLKQIKCEVVGVADLPTDEVIAPGKIEANPNRVSKVVLPVTGRIAKHGVRPANRARVPSCSPLMAAQSVRSPLGPNALFIRSTPTTSFAKPARRRTRTSTAFIAAKRPSSYWPIKNCDRAACSICGCTPPCSRSLA